MITNTPVGQIAAALLVAATPWIVLRIALAAATRHSGAEGGPIPPLRAVTFLGRATAMAALVVGSLAALLPAPSGWMAVIEGVVFAGLAAVALRALHELDTATRATRYVDSVTREASLVPRRRHHYLPVPWRILLFGLTITGLASGASSVDPPGVRERVRSGHRLSGTRPHAARR